MNIGIYDQFQRKQARYLTKRSQIVLKQQQSIVQVQVDYFTSYEYDRSKPSLETIISACQTYNQGDERRLELLNKAFRYHGGLAAKIARCLKSYGIVLEYGQIYGFFWEALIRLPDAWDNKRSTAQMALASITTNIATKWADEHTFRGGVRVPRQQTKKDDQGNTVKTKSGRAKREPTRFIGVSLNYDQDLEGLRDIPIEAQNNFDLILSLAY